MKEQFEFEGKQEIPVGTDEYIRKDLGEYNTFSPTASAEMLITP